MISWVHHARRRGNQGVFSPRSSYIVGLFPKMSTHSRNFSPKCLPIDGLSTRDVYPKSSLLPTMSTHNRIYFPKSLLIVRCFSHSVCPQSGLLPIMSTHNRAYCPLEFLHTHTSHPSTCLSTIGLLPLIVVHSKFASLYVCSWSGLIPEIPAYSRRPRPSKRPANS